MIKRIRTGLAACLFITSCLSLFTQAQEVKPRANWPIVTRSGDQLVEGDRPFRFLGLCSSALNTTKDQILPDWSNRWPNEYEIRSTLDGMSRIGARATRVGIGLTIASPQDSGARYIYRRAGLITRMRFGRWIGCWRWPMNTIYASSFR